MTSLEAASRCHFQRGGRPHGADGWELMERLGAGRSGEVWKAREIRPPGGIVTLKFCLDPEAPRRLLRETDLLARVQQATRQHPGLVELLEARLDLEPPCLVYEYVEGETLAAFIEKRQKEGVDLDPWEAAGLVRELAEIIAACHALEPPVIHGNLAPESIQVEFGEDGEPRFRVADFGMGRFTSFHFAGGPEGGDVFPSASPAQRRGEEPEARDDVYALGVIWWQLLCSDLLEAAPSERHCKQRLLSRGGPPALVDLLAECLEPEALMRPADAGVLADRLRGLLDDGGGGWPVSSPEGLSGEVEMAPASFHCPALPQSLPVSGPPAGLGLFATVLPKIRRDGPRAGDEHGIDIGGGAEMTFCWVPEGSFIMGSLWGEAGRRADENPVETAVTTGFWMARTPCTQEQWAAVMGGCPALFRGDNLPVENVDWEDCQEFLQALPPLEGGWRYSLPTEAEWEHACRAGAIRISYDEIDQMAWHKGNAGGRPQPVGLKKPNAWGFHDMLGNVGEWCLDWYQDFLVGGADPSGPETGAMRSYRGGSWYTASTSCRAASRDKLDPGIACNDLGFRVILVPGETDLPAS